MALPSPISATTGRCGSASFTPIAAGSPQPMPPPRRPKKLLASSHVKNVAHAGARGDRLVDDRWRRRAWPAPPRARARAAPIGARLADCRAASSSSARSAALAATAASRRLAACGGRSCRVRSPPRPPRTARAASPWDRPGSPTCGRVVLADLPRVDVDVDDVEPVRHRLHVGGQREREEVGADREQQVVRIRSARIGGASRGNVPP